MRVVRNSLRSDMTRVHSRMPAAASMLLSYVVVHAKWKSECSSLTAMSSVCVSALEPTAYALATAAAEDALLGYIVCAH